MIAGPYHQAGPGKAHDFKPVRGDMNVGGDDIDTLRNHGRNELANGITSYLIVFTPIQSSTA